MATEMWHDIVVHYKGSVNHILNIDPDKYNHMDLIADSCEIALSNVPTSHAIALDLYGVVPRFELKCDQDLLRMFGLYVGIKEIPIYFDVAHSSAPMGFEETHETNMHLQHGSNSRSAMGFRSRPSMVNDLFRDLDDYSDVDWNELGDDNNIDCEDGEEDEAYMVSDSNEEDEEWNGEEVEEEIHEDDGNRSNLGGLSDYESNDDEGNYSSDEQDVQAINADRNP
ncbi:unnamed protein product [Camellia sinensis]